jgi:hypothetical protein
LHNNFQQINNPNEERFIGPLLPFVGGALIGYVVARPNNNNYYPIPYYTPYYTPYPIYQQPPIYK